MKGRFQAFAVVLLGFVPLFLVGRDAPVSTAGSSSLCPGAIATVPLTVTNFTSVTAISLRLDYDPSLLTFINYSNLNASLGGAMVNDVLVSPNLRKVLIVWTNTTPLTLSNGSKLLDLNFTLTAGTASVTFNNSAGGGGECEYADEFGNPMNDVPSSVFYQNATITSLGTGSASAITGSTVLCAGAVNMPYSVAPIVNASGYIWTVPSGATIVGPSNTNTIVVNFPTATTGNIAVAGTGSCGTGSTTTLPVTVNSLPVPTIAGISPVCAGSTGVPYTTEAGMTGYGWIISPGGVITSGGNTNSILVTWNTSGPHYLMVSYTNGNGCTAATPTLKNITVNPRPIPTITGAGTSCPGTAGVSYTTEPGMTGYAWTISPGGIITSGSNTNQVMVTWNSTGTQTLTVSYTNANGCTAAAPSVKTVVVNARPVPAISGPGAVCAGSTGVSYTTEPGMSGYTWTISSGGTITSGSNTNAILVSWNTTGPQTLTVNYTNPGGCSALTPTQKTVNVNALPVPLITGSPAACAGTTGNPYSTESGMSGYVWTITSGGTITSGSGTNSILVTWNTPGNQVLTVSYANSNSCFPANASVKTVTVNPRPVPVITGPASVCAGTAGVPYTTEAGMSGYVWTISSGGTITAGSGTSSIVVAWNTSGNQNLTVTYTDPNTGCAPLAPANKAVTVKSQPVPTLSGPGVVCENAPSNVYTTEAGMTGYTWSVSPGGLITSGGGPTNNNITITWISPGPQTLSVNYSNAEGCSAAAPSTYNVQVNPLPAAAGIISGPAGVCQGASGIVYSTSVIQNAITYLWTFPPGIVVTSGSGTNIVTVTFGSSAQSGNISVVGNNTCGNGTGSPLFQVTADLPAGPSGQITGPSSVCAGASGVIFSVAPIVNATGYLWAIPSGATITAGVNTNQITVKFAGAPGSATITVRGVNGCGPGVISPLFNLTINPAPATPVITDNGPVLTSSAPVGNQWWYEGNPIQDATGEVYTVTHNTGYYWTVVTLEGCPSEPSNKIWVEVTGLEENPAEEFVIYPVPNAGEFTLRFRTSGSSDARVSIYNSLGIKVFEIDDLKNTDSSGMVIKLSHVENGIYTAILEHSSHIMVRKIILLRK